MNATSRVILRVIGVVCAPLGAALRASEELMAPQMDAGCKGHTAPLSKARD